MHGLRLALQACCSSRGIGNWHGAVLQSICSALAQAPKPPHLLRVGGLLLARCQHLPRLRCHLHGLFR